MGELHSLTTFPSTETNSIPLTGLHTHTHKHTDLQLVDTNLKVFKVSLGEGQFLPLEAITLSPAIVRERGGECVCVCVCTCAYTHVWGMLTDGHLQKGAAWLLLSKAPIQRDVLYLLSQSQVSFSCVNTQFLFETLRFSFLFLFIEIHI